MEEGEDRDERKAWEGKDQTRRPVLDGAKRGTFSFLLKDMGFVCLFCVCFCLCLWHVEVPRPGMEPTP